MNILDNKYKHKYNKYKYKYLQMLGGDILTHLQSNKYLLEKERDDDQHPTCICCFEPLTDPNISIILKCGHVFHNDCIQKYFNSTVNDRNKCPVCKKVIIENEIKNFSSIDLSLFSSIDLNKYYLINIINSSETIPETSQRPVISQRPETSFGFSPVSRLGYSETRERLLQERDRLAQEREVLARQIQQSDTELAESARLIRSEAELARERFLQQRENRSEAELARERLLQQRANRSVITRTPESLQSTNRSIRSQSVTRFRP